jgi:hypothetical protein
MVYTEKTRLAGSQFSLSARGGTFLCPGCNRSGSGNGAARRESPAVSLIASPLEIFCEFILAEAIQNAFFRHAALARHLDAPMRQVNFPRRVRIRVDAHHAAKTQGRLVPAPVKVKHRQGFALISTATLCSAQAVRTFSISMS